MTHVHSCTVHVFRGRILGWNDTVITATMETRYRQFRRYMVAALCIDVCYLLYSVAFKEVNPKGRSALGFMLVAADIVVRKVRCVRVWVQRVSSVWE
jgi:hypothetical protein